MDPLRLIIAGTGIGLIVLLVWSDWRVRTGRTAALLTVLIGLVVATAVGDWIPSQVAWVFGPALLVVMILHPRWLAPLGGPDLTMIEQIEAIERALLRASEAYRKGSLRLSELHDKFGQIRRRLARLQPPDDEWRRVMGLLRADLDRTMAAVTGTEHRSADAVREDRRRFRSIYSEMLKSRLRFWR